MMNGRHVPGKRASRICISRSATAAAADFDEVTKAAAAAAATLRPNRLNIEL